MSVHEATEPRPYVILHQGIQCYWAREYVSMQISASVFAKVNSLHITIYKGNDSLCLSWVLCILAVEKHEEKVNIKLARQLPCDSLMATLKHKKLA